MQGKKNIRDVIVEKIYPFGIFVKLEDQRTGYIRRRELSWDRYIDPQIVFKPGQHLNARIVNSYYGQTLELSHRLTLPNPWTKFVREYRVGDRVEGRVCKVYDNQIYVEVMPGVEGVISLDELSDQPMQNAQELFWLDDWVSAQITNLDAEGTKLNLSIKQLLVQEKRIADLIRSLHSSDLLEDSHYFIDRQQENSRHANPAMMDLSQLGTILIVDDKEKLLDSFAYWLRERKCIVYTAATYQEAEQMLTQRPYDTVIVDIELDDGFSGISLIEQHHTRCHKTRVIVMSIPSNIRTHLNKMIDLDISTVLSKPLDMDEIERILIEVAAGTASGIEPLEKATDIPEQNSESSAVNVENQGALKQQIVSLLSTTVQQTGAEFGILFQKSNASGLIQILYDERLVDVAYGATDMLRESPVNDVIERERLIHENRASQNEGRYLKLIEMIQFESCIGVPILSGHENDHALFLLHAKANIFGNADIESAKATATHLGAVLERISFAERIRFLDKMMLSGQLASGFAHEIYNQLSALNLQVRNLTHLFQRVNETPTNPTQGDDTVWPTFSGMVDDLSSVTKDLMGTATSFRLSLQPGNQATTSIQSILNDTCKILYATSLRNRVQIEIQPIPERANIQVDNDIALHIFLNIMLNGVQHIADMKRKRGSIEITVRYQADSEWPIQIRCTDNGPGIHQRLWKQIFQPGFSTRPEGTGWGLHIVHTLTQSIGGRVQVEKSIMQIGTTFLIELPLTSTEIETNEK